MSNLIKYNSFVIKEQEKLIIDSNKMMDEILEQRRLLNASKESARVADEDGFICGLDAAKVEQLVHDDDGTEENTGENTKSSAEFTPIDLTEIHKQEEEILSQAREEAESIREKNII